MTPRPYRQGQRLVASERTRTRIVLAARDLLVSPRLDADFSLEAVARRAKVTRRTVYLHCGSRRALIEAAFDAVAADGGIERIAEVFAMEDARAALRRAVEIFGEFWTAGRLGIRRVHGHAEFDPDLAAAMRQRNERRRLIFRTLLQRYAAATGRPSAADLEQVLTTVFGLTSFEVFDALAGPEREPKEMTGVIQDLVERVVLGRGNGE